MKVTLDFEFTNQDEVKQEIVRLAKDGIITTVDEIKQYFIEHIDVKWKMNETQDG